MKKLAYLLALLIWLNGAVAAQAEDLDVYGTEAIEVKPNVLVIFDNSKSMDSRDIVPPYPFDPNATYDGPFTKTAVYIQDPNTSSYMVSYKKFADTLSHPTCTKVTTGSSTVTVWDAVSQTGMSLDAPVKLVGINAICAADAPHKEAIYSGNYLNYLRTRLEVAQEAVVNLVNSTGSIDFGMMIFNRDQGGKVVQPIGVDKTTLVDAVNRITTNLYTPLAETLAEAGLYFAGKTSWYNTGVSYTSPIEYRCQKNYVILMTDGEPMQDDDLINKRYIDSTQPVLKDEGVKGSLLDDIADYLHVNDLRPTLGEEGDQFEDQTVTTYTIGFKSVQTLLESTAVRGGGQYYTALDSSALKDAFESILDSILETNASFVAPTVPPSDKNRMFAGDRIYLGLFKPKQSGRWLGNLKAYKLSPAGVILDANNQPATDANGMIKATAQSLWSSSPDGYNVDQGGAGGKLLANDSRNIYTFITGNSTNLTHAANRFSLDNALVTESLLGVSAALRADIITSVRAENRDWPLGDIVHSGPVVQYHLTATGIIKSYIYVGANDGMLHAIDGDTGEEAWAFIPPGQLSRLQKLLDDGHDYFVDGSLSLHEKGTKKILFFGERRGSSYYYALDVTDPLQPTFKYRLNEALLETLDWDNNGEEELSGGATLSQSWSRPREVRLKVGSSSYDLLLLTGGYDPNQDQTTPAASDTAGRAIFAIDPDSGAVTALNVNGALWPAMTHCILDASPIDRNYDGYVERVYAGDLGGNVLALRDADHDGNWEKHLLFDLPPTLIVGGQTINLGRKFMYAPEVAAEPFGELIYIGTGDREAPTATTHVDAMYAIPSTWQTIDPAGEAYQTLTPGNLVDVTDNKIQDGSDEEKASAETALKLNKGWQMRLPNPGEKVVSSPLLYNKTLYFTTYTPGTDTASFTDPCSSDLDRGVARLYAVDYLNGGARFDFFKDPENPGNLGKEDRSVVIGTSIPSGPSVVVTKEGVVIQTGVEGGVFSHNDGSGSAIRQYFWRQIR